MVFDFTKEWGKPEPRRVLDVIREVGIHRLGNLDGCLCTSFEIRNVEVVISCGKGNDRGCWISSQSGDYPSDEVELAGVLDEVGAEVQRQVADLSDGRGPMPVHYRPWSK